MPDVTTTEFVVTSYVNQNYSGSYQTRSSGGYTYREYDNARGDFWFDNDGDGFFEYGRRDEGYGQWSTFQGFGWEDVPPPPLHPEGHHQDEVDPNGMAMEPGSEPELELESAADLFPPDLSHAYDGMNPVQPPAEAFDSGWTL